MIREILRMGDERLLRQAQTVTEFDTRELHTLIADMFDTMEHKGGVGLAAPQIGENLRIVIFGFESNERYPDAPAVPVTVLINPEIELIGDEMEDGWEGCLSVPGLRGLVPRYLHLRYKGVDPGGRLIDRTAEGFHARVVQHECDHLDGMLYPRRMRDLRFFGFSEEILEGQSRQPKLPGNKI
jgi:peptide deformylase